MPVRDLDPLLGLCDPFSALSHGALGLFLLAQAWFLMRRADGDPRRLLSLWGYVLGVSAMFLFSATYHGLPYTDPLKTLYWKLDHASIWIGLAVIHTPVQLLCCRPEDHRRRLVPIWAMAILGSALEVSVLDTLPSYVSPLLYVGMGWACFPVLWGAYRGPGRRFFWPLLAAGIGATLGGFVDASSRPTLWPGLFEAHEICHLLTSLGGVVYWWAIWSLASGEYEQAAGSLAPARSEEPSGLATA